jgi:choline dehydrogenase-like flavoprotein
MIYMRGQKEDWDHWASLGNRGWSWEEVLPLFKGLEDYEHGVCRSAEREHVRLRFSTLPGAPIFERTSSVGI